MNPALSIIVFTVSSGAGLGLIAVTAIFAVFAIGDLSAGVVIRGLSCGLVLTAIGLAASTLHLANPKNAWRAFSRLRSSWLSREGVLAVLLFPVASIYLLGVSFANGAAGWMIKFAGLITVLLALATLFATGMIYACLRTIRQWNTALVPANYLLLGGVTGTLILNVIVVFEQGVSGIIAAFGIIMLAIAGMGKALYYLWIGKPQGATINTATGFTRARVKLLDAGHSVGTFHTQEFGYQASTAWVSRWRGMVYAFGFVAPIALCAWSVQAQYAAAAVLALASTMLGVVTERWLFFVEARHSINLYHGHQRV